jgi:phage shock protein PspC (stress-responsive transcriptional regulator)
MRKVTTINLNNNAYQIDEDGFEALRDYLDRAERALAGNPAIADKCRLALGPYKTVINAAEIERILKEMGPVAGSTEEATADAGPAASSYSSTAGNAARPRRLFRLRDGQTWAGVCNGLAAYAAVDVTWVRVAFVMLTIFAAGFGLLAYFVLVFVMPIATTPEEIAAAHGQPVSAQELVDRAKKKVMSGARSAGLVAG